MLDYFSINLPPPPCHLCCLLLFCFLLIYHYNHLQLSIVKIYIKKISLLFKIKYH